MWVWFCISLLLDRKLLQGGNHILNVGHPVFNDIVYAQPIRRWYQLITHRATLLCVVFSPHFCWRRWLAFIPILALVLLVLVLFRTRAGRTWEPRRCKNPIQVTPKVGYSQETLVARGDTAFLHSMPENRLGYGDRRRGFVRVQNQEVEASQQSNAPGEVAGVWDKQQAKSSGRYTALQPAASRSTSEVPNCRRTTRIMPRSGTSPRRTYVPDFCASVRGVCSTK